MRKLGVGVLGIGEMGRCHAEIIRRAVPQARLVAVASATGSTERARQTAYELEIEHSYTNLEAMLECKELDAIVIASPDKFHAQAIDTAARAGKSILCEKPLALNLADAQAALAAVAEARVHLHIGFMRRYDPAYAAAMKRIEAGEIGVPVIFKSIGRDKDAPPLASYEAGLNGMLLYNNTIHDFDMARWLMRDEITAVHCYTTAAIRPEVARYSDVVASSVNLQFEKGAIGNIESYVQAVYGYDVRTEIVGSTGTILVGNLQGTAATVLTVSGGTQDLAAHFLNRFADAYVAQLRDFVENVLFERPPRISGKDGLKALAVAVAAEQSYLRSEAAKVSVEVSLASSDCRFRPS
jgi:scyllo-inositol 2-dehydrogenase (NAD+)